ncbi:META domain-containing protein [Rhodococcus gannanensis]|uniref:META domain-containing protein n=1 Tax=Rhodococcus gannanensis TaxID=1960308 RepID=A0ABW4P6E6_9NOCA
MRTLRLAALAIAALALAACSDSGSAASDSPQSDLLGRTFVSTTVDGAQIPGGGPLTVEFTEPDRIAGTAGCNRATGTADFSGGTIVTGPLATTMMACMGENADSDQWLASFFAAKPAWELDGDTLTLRTDASTVTLLDRRIAQPDRPLTGTTWVVDTTITPAAVTSSLAIEKAAPTLQIADDGTVTGSTGCNSFTGRAEVSGETITFGPLATTRRACVPELAEVEQAVLTTLTGTATATVESDRLQLMNTNGTGLGLRAR